MSSPTLPRHRLRSRRPLTTPDPLPEPDGPAPAQADADRAAALELEVAQLRAAMASRAAIEQAKGILMLLTGCTDQVAFDLLSHISGHTHRKLRDVAQAITASASGGAGLPADIRAILRDACPPGTSRA
ncbi:ANTAR domain-containing protein [Blastococcus aurantiacus]|uniref:ANTAR domain-containing protein n=1 Tax=Blastococcus aurantiacus TaxID=1550231 RepID=A0A1G7MIX3_9ACTN|nr:ANTAR domain-containing protein [Blastococcus aurantiacus]SDF61735.1 ANTAR domain-containing protein [Blastococcus aurantiacus]